MKTNLQFGKQLFAAAMALLFSIGASAQTAPISVRWEMGRNGAQPKGVKTLQYTSFFTIKNIGTKPLEGNWDFYFNQFDRSQRVMGDAGEFEISMFRTGYYRLSPAKNYRTLAPGDSVRVDMMSNIWLNGASYRPDGGHFVWRDGADKPLAVAIELPLFKNPEQWEVPGRRPAFFPDGENMYNLNNSLFPEGAKIKGSEYNIIPTPKSVRLLPGSTEVAARVRVDGEGRAADYLIERLLANGKSLGDAGTLIRFTKLSRPHESNEYYELTVNRGTVTIAADNDDAALNGVKTFMAVLENARFENAALQTLRNAIVKDYPDLGHRGMMLDVSRNFTTYENMRRYIDALATLKVNQFRFHITDDEAWRLEIPGLPELTEVGSRKGFTRDESEFLMQTYAGTGNPDDNTSANGFYTRQQYIELIKYAYNRGIYMFPEIESPGHARAAIVSMKARYNRYKDTDFTKACEYMLWDENDTSKYSSAQNYHDNVMNIGMEGTYRFMQKVIDEIVEMYREANVPLYTIHIGGDEVPSGSWTGSPAVARFLKDHGYTTLKEASEYFIDRVSQMVVKKGVGVGGWQEVAMHHSAEYNRSVAPRFNIINSWSTIGRNDTVPYSIANSGFPVVLSNVTNLYFDMMHTWHPEECGLNWGGTVDEFASWGIIPYNSYRSARYDDAGRNMDFRNAHKGKIALRNRDDIRGIDGQIFAETIRNFDMVTQYTFPRVIGLAERGWNASPVWADDSDDLRYEADRSQFNLKVGRELRRIAGRGFIFHVGQPGVVVRNGKILVNTRYPGMTTRYTTDGTEPDASSPEWTAPVPTDAKTVKAKSFFLGSESYTTTYNAE